MYFYVVKIFRLLSVARVFVNTHFYNSLALLEQIGDSL